MEERRSCSMSSVTESSSDESSDSNSLHSTVERDVEITVPEHFVDLQIATLASTVDPPAKASTPTIAKKVKLSAEQKAAAEAAAKEVAAAKAVQERILAHGVLPPILTDAPAPLTFRCYYCKTRLRGELCSIGPSCMFAHSQEELRTVEQNVADKLFTLEAIQKFLPKNGIVKKKQRRRKNRGKSGYDMDEATKKKYIEDKIKAQEVKRQKEREEAEKARQFILSQQKMLEQQMLYNRQMLGQGDIPPWATSPPTANSSAVKHVDPFSASSFGTISPPTSNLLAGNQQLTGSELMHSDNHPGQLSLSISSQKAIVSDNSPSTFESAGGHARSISPTHPLGNTGIKTQLSSKGHLKSTSEQSLGAIGTPIIVASGSSNNRIVRKGAKQPVNVPKMLSQPSLLPAPVMMPSNPIIPMHPQPLSMNSSGSGPLSVTVGLAHVPLPMPSGIETAYSPKAKATKVPVPEPNPPTLRVSIGKQPPLKVSVGVTTPPAPAPLTKAPHTLHQPTSTTVTIGNASSGIHHVIESPTTGIKDITNPNGILSPNATPFSLPPHYHQSQPAVKAGTVAVGNPRKSGKSSGSFSASESPVTASLSQKARRSSDPKRNATGQPMVMGSNVQIPHVPQLSFSQGLPTAATAAAIGAQIGAQPLMYPTVTPPVVSFPPYLFGQSPLPTPSPAVPGELPQVLALVPPSIASIKAGTTTNNVSSASNTTDHEGGAGALELHPKPSAEVVGANSTSTTSPPPQVDTTALQPITFPPPVMQTIFIPVAGPDGTVTMTPAFMPVMPYGGINPYLHLPTGQQPAIYPPFAAQGSVTGPTQEAPSVTTSHVHSCN